MLTSPSSDRSVSPHNVWLANQDSEMKMWNDTKVLPLCLSTGSHQLNEGDISKRRESEPCSGL